jgi:hypothetical protein
MLSGTVTAPQAGQSSSIACRKQKRPPCSHSTCRAAAWPVLQYHMPGRGRPGLLGHLRERRSGDRRFLLGQRINTHPDVL